ncbi:hypothetical protein DINM_002165 [Dirofilaria immitis]|nr:hypothetical protein [Dirofilaria immitis]
MISYDSMNGTHFCLLNEPGASPKSVTRGFVQFIVFFDAATLNLIDYLNPLSAQVKFWQMRSELWQDWSISQIGICEFVNDLQSYDKTGVSGSKGIQQPKLRRKEISAGAVFV